MYVVFNRKTFTKRRKGAVRKHLNEKAFFSGREGFKVNSHNPNRRNTLEYKEWERGYNREYFINLNRVLKIEQNESAKPIHRA